VGNRHIRYNMLRPWAEAGCRSCRHAVPCAGPEHSPSVFNFFSWISFNNAAIQLIALRRYDNACQELQRAIACDEPFGHAAEPWKTFGTLRDLERAVGTSTAAATARQRAL